MLTATIENTNPEVAVMPAKKTRTRTGNPSTLLVYEQGLEEDYENVARAMRTSMYNLQQKSNTLPVPIVLREGMLWLEATFNRSVVVENALYALMLDLDNMTQDDWA